MKRFAFLSSKFRIMERLPPNWLEATIEMHASNLLSLMRKTDKSRQALEEYKLMTNQTKRPTARNLRPTALNHARMNMNQSVRSGRERGRIASNSVNRNSFTSPSSSHPVLKMLKMTAASTTTPHRSMALAPHKIYDDTAPSPFFVQP